MARADIAQPLNGYFLRKDTVITIFLKKNSDLIHGFKKKERNALVRTLQTTGVQLESFTPAPCCILASEWKGLL